MGNSVVIMLIMYSMLLFYNVKHNIIHLQRNAFYEHLFYIYLCIISLCILLFVLSGNGVYVKCLLIKSLIINEFLIFLNN